MLRRLDAFGKPRDDLLDRSALGGFVTLLASMAAALLFVAQLYVYLTGVTRNSLHLAESYTFPVPLLASHGIAPGREKLPLHFSMSFPHLACNKLDAAHDNLSSQDPKFADFYGNTAVKKRALSVDEYLVATGKPSLRSSRELHAGCTISGHYYVPKVAGSFSVTLTGQVWAEVTTFLIMGGLVGGLNDKLKLAGHHQHNVSHYVHYVTFGEAFPLMKNPLKDLMNMVENESGGIALANIHVKLVPTMYQNFFGSKDTFQMSVTEHIVQPETMATQGSQFLPGIAVTYDFTPVKVHHVEFRDNLFVFISSLVSIVGGAFVTVRLITGCLVQSAAAAVSKKVD